MGVTPVPVEAIKEQHSEIEILKKELKGLINKNELSAEYNSNLDDRLKAIEVLLAQRNSN
jgi:hypothetical protein